MPFSEKASAQETVKSLPNRYGVAITAGNTYSPENNISFAQVTGLALYDYGKIWGHKAPVPLWFKVEANIGSTTRPDKKLISSVNMFALYYLEEFSYKSFRPYIEGGIGVIYTDFKVDGQGLRFNFNPQMGIGTEFKVGSDTTLFTALRLHHISNGGLNHENTGISSVTVSLGRFF
jgi:hypothetical protein